MSARLGYTVPLTLMYAVKSSASGDNTSDSHL